jgi:signal transduction histidine kinase
VGPDLISIPTLWLDAGRIQQVFDNLLSNAVKFTAAGGTIRVSAALQEAGNGQERWVEVRVSDTGMGIPAEEVERVFDKFYQSPYHRKENRQGTGLGLAIARHAVEAHGGRIWVESQVGEGSTFVFTLPVSDESAHTVLGVHAWSTKGDSRRLLPGVGQEAR